MKRAILLLVFILFSIVGYSQSVREITTAIKKSALKFNMPVDLMK